MFLMYLDYVVDQKRSGSLVVMYQVQYSCGGSHVDEMRQDRWLTKIVHCSREAVNEMR